MLCYVMLCYVMLCYVMLCYVMLCCITLHLFVYSFDNIRIEENFCPTVDTQPSCSLMLGAVLSRNASKIKMFHNCVLLD